MKKYDVTIKVFTGSYYLNGEKCYNEVARVRTNNLDYIDRIYQKKTNDESQQGNHTAHCAPHHVLHADAPNAYHVRRQ